MKRTTRYALLILASGLLLAGCGEKMTDEQFVAAATSMYEAVQERWDIKPEEAWSSYLERRVGQSCAEAGVNVKMWDKKLVDVRKHQDKYEELLEPQILAQILKWQEDRIARKKSQE